MMMIGVIKVVKFGTENGKKKGFVHVKNAEPYLFKMRRKSSEQNEDLKEEVKTWEKSN